MIVIVEGIDRVGKTTLVKKLEKMGFISLKDEFLSDPDGMEFAHYSFGKCESLFQAAKLLTRQGKNIVIDRLHLTELAYGLSYRMGNTLQQKIFELDELIRKENSVLVHVEPSNMELSNKLAKIDQSQVYKHMDYAFKMSGVQKAVCTYNSLDQMVELLLDRANAYDFYFASPFFNQEQVEREERMIAHLRSLGFKVFSPKESCNLNPTASKKSRELVFSQNCLAIRKSKAVFAVTDGKDMGTIWEAGYAYGIGKPVLYYAETLGTNKFNLMLAESGNLIFTRQDQVTRGILEAALIGEFQGDAYGGEIE